MALKDDWVGDKAMIRLAPRPAITTSPVPLPQNRKVPLLLLFYLVTSSLSFLVALASTK